MGNKKRSVMEREPKREGFLPSRFWRDVEDMWEDLWGTRIFRPFEVPRRATEMLRRTSPRTDFRDKGDAFEIKTELPGISKENVEITLDEDSVEIIAEEATEKEEKDEGRYFYREIGSRTYRRRFNIPEEIDGKKVDASMKEGVLTIELPKKEKKAKKKHRINIK